MSINSPAVRTPELITAGATRFGSQCIVVAIDAKRMGDRWEVFIDGGRVPTGLDAVAWAREVERLGAGEILLTSMDTDGTQAGYDLPMLRAVADAVSIPVIASGGAGTLEHFYDALTSRRRRRGPGGLAVPLPAAVGRRGQEPTWPSAACRCALDLKRCRRRMTRQCLWTG